MTNIATVGDLDIGTYLKIFSTKGVYNNLSEESELWKLMQKKRVAKPEGREVRYLLRDSYGSTATQMVAPGAEGAFPKHQRGSQKEATAFFKDFATTVDVPRHLMNKTGSDLAQYADPLAEELDIKGIATARMLSRQLCGDGSGRVGKASAAVLASGKIEITLSTANADSGASHIGNFEQGEDYLIAALDGTLQVSGVNAETYFRCEDIDEANDKIVVQGYNASDVPVTASGSVAGIASGNIYPLFDGAAPDLTAISDYNRLSYAMVGLESLTATDGRLVNGLNMTGAIKGTRKSAGGATIDRTHFQSVLSEVKRAVGKNKYKYKNALMFDTVYDSMMESWETDRQIISASDNDRGTDSLGYKHGKDLVKFETDEFVSKNRIWLPPEGDVIHYRGTDIEQVKVGGSTEFMPSKNGQHQRAVRSYLEGSGLLFVTHPKAVACIEDFTV